MKILSSRLILLWISFLIFGSCSQKQERLKAGEPAPLFTLQDPSGQTISLKQLSGKTILLHFWADWCADCRAEFPKLQAAYKKLKNHNFEIIAINVGQSREHVQSFIESYHLTFFMAMDENTDIAKLYHIKGLPTNYFLKPNLTIHKIIIGWVHDEQIRKILSSIHEKEKK